MRRRLPGLLLAALALGAACGLVGRPSPVGFQLPRQSFLLSTDDSQWQAPPERYTMPPPYDCATPDDCCAPHVPTVSCTQFPIVCGTGRCAVEFPFQLVTVVDLARDAPELAQARGMVAAGVTLESLDYTVMSDLTIALPEVALYVAPRSVATANDARARRLATIPITNAGFQGSGSVALSADGQDAFDSFARDLQTPFHLIAVTTITLRSGAPAPMGGVQLSVTGRATAKF